MSWPRAVCRCAPFQVVGGQCVPRHQAVDIAVLHHGLHRGAGVIVEGEGRPHDPQDVAVLSLIAQKLKQVVVVPGVGGLSAAPLAEDKLVGILILPFLEAAGMEVDPLLAVLAPPEDDLVASLEVPVLHHRQAAVVTEDDAGVHAALLGQEPLPIYFEIFGIHGCAVKIFRGDPVLLDLLDGCVGGIYKYFLSKIWFAVLWHLKSHNHNSPFVLYFILCFVRPALHRPGQSNHYSIESAGVEQLLCVCFWGAFRAPGRAGGLAGQKIGKRKILKTGKRKIPSFLFEILCYNKTRWGISADGSAQHSHC